MNITACRTLSLILILAVWLCAGRLGAVAQEPRSECASVEVDLSECFSDHDAAFVMFDVRSNRWSRHNVARCAQRFSPCSTFKIPNALIALDTGVVPDEAHVIKWDGRTNSRAAANRDHTLKSAVSESIVWYFQEIARRVGTERMQRYVDTFDYGNRDLTGGLTNFWLSSSLQISPDEQVRFLDRLRRGDLPCDRRSLDIVRSLIVHSDDGTTIVRGKTGSDGQGLGWYVGWIERGDDAYVFAACVSGPDVWGIPVRDMALKALKTMDVLPGKAAD